MDKAKIHKLAILARTKVNVDVDAIKLWYRYHDRIKKLEGVDDNKADELEKEWKTIFKGLVQLMLPNDLSNEEYDEALNYLWPEQQAEGS